MNIRRLLILSLLSITVISCHRKPAATSTDQPAVRTDSVSAAIGPISTRIRLTHTDSTAWDSTRPFHARDTVHAVIHTENASDTSTLDGKWVYVPKNAIIAENKANLSAGTNETHFDLMNAHPWPAGEYELVVEVDAKVRDSVRFAILPTSSRK